MTKKDYVKFAQMLYDATCCKVDCEAENMRQEIAEKMADIFQNDNGNFDRGRFLKAADVN